MRGQLESQETAQAADSVQMLPDVSVIHGTDSNYGESMRNQDSINFDLRSASPVRKPYLKKNQGRIIEKLPAHLRLQKNILVKNSAILRSFGSDFDSIDRTIFKELQEGLPDKHLQDKRMFM